MAAILQSKIHNEAESHGQRLIRPGLELRLLELEGNVTGQVETLARTVEKLGEEAHVAQHEFGISHTNALYHGVDLSRSSTDILTSFFQRAYHVSVPIFYRTFDVNKELLKAAVSPDIAARLIEQIEPRIFQVLPDFEMIDARGFGRLGLYGDKLRDMLLAHEGIVDHLVLHYSKMITVFISPVRSTKAPRIPRPSEAVRVGASAIAEPTVSANPRDEFSPSVQLARLLKSSLTKWDSETEAALAEQAKSTGMLKEEGLSEDEGLAYIITEAVEGTLVDTARQNAARGLSTVLLNDGKRFSSEICAELIWRLDLDSYDPRQFLDQLYHELREFAAFLPRKRAWGQLTVERGIDLRLEIDVAAASAFPDVNDSDEEGWIVSE